MAASTGSAADPDRRKVLSRISEIERILQSVLVANPPADAERVAFGAAVTVRHASGEQVSYRIVGMDESEPDQNQISWLSPLAGRLMKRRAGDRFRFRSPAGEEELEIIAVQYPP
jgi:transcription elongation factor GreB